MKKHIIMLSLILSASISSADSLVYLGSHFNYLRFKFNNPSQMKGYLAGIKAGYTVCGSWFYSDINMEGYWNAGPVTGKPCQRSAIQEYFAKLKLGAGFNFHCDRMSLTAYTGFGYNHFHNKQDPTVDGLSYKYTKLFVPVGILIDGCINETIGIGAQVEARPDVFSRVKVVCEKLALKKQFAVRAQAPLTFYVGCRKQHAIGIVPFFDWNKFGKTTACTSNGIMLPIPSLTRWELGTRLMFSYTF